MSTHARRVSRPHSQPVRRLAGRHRHTGDTTVRIAPGRAPLPGPAPQNGVPRALERPAGERDLAVRLALDRLPEPRDRVIIVMRFFLGLSLRQIAERLGIHPREVIDRYRLGLRLLDKQLRGHL